MFGVVLLVLTIGLVLDDTNAANLCFEAKICIHNGVEKCGVDSKGNARWFLDACDIKEYNCIKSTDYVKTGPEKCQNLPPLENNENEDQPPEVNKYWCWRSSICHSNKLDSFVCAKDIQQRKRVFKKFMNQCSVFKRNCVSRTGLFISTLLFVQHRHPAAATPDEEIDTAILVSQYYCHRFKSCKSPASGPICGYSEADQYLADFSDVCAMFKTNCNGNGRVVFYLIEKEICDMKKKYDEEHKNEVFEWERISRVTFKAPPTPTPITQPTIRWNFSQRMKLAV